MRGEEAPGSWLGGKSPRERSPFAAGPDLGGAVAPLAVRVPDPGSTAASRRHNEGRHALYEPEDLLSLAEYSWREMGNPSDSAQLLFERVLETDPANPTALASYALFLWECEASGRLSVLRLLPRDTSSGVCKRSCAAHGCKSAMVALTSDTKRKAESQVRCLAFVHKEELEI